VILQLLHVVSDKPPAVPTPHKIQPFDINNLSVNVNTFHKIVFIPLFTIHIVQELIVGAHDVINTLKSMFLA
jgi:hypothetical protein